VRVYVASSWRNAHQPAVVAALRVAGHEVYDFREPMPGSNGFHWTEVESAPKPWSGETLRVALQHPISKAGFESDMGALRTCDACVLVLPCGRSAHLELGWAAGAGKFTTVLMPAPDEPELMYRMLDEPVCTTVAEVLDLLAWYARMGGAQHG
jgi:hypothetical protein